MNALLLIAILAWCERSPDRDACVRRELACAVAGGAYELVERKATRVVADCITREKKP